MATHWLREISFLTTPTRYGYSFYSKMLCYWMYNVLGYTNFSQSVTPVGSDTYNPAVAFTGNHASFNATGTDYNLVDATYGAFAIGDVGKWILIKSTTIGEEANSGWYRVTANPDGNTVTLDYRCGVGEFPIQHVGTNLEWWMLAEDENTPDTIGDYWRLRTPHADGWEVETLLNGNELRFRVSLDADWTASGKILKGAATANSKVLSSGATLSANTYQFAEAESNGDHFNLWFMSTTAGCQAVSIAKMQPYEALPLHAATELWVLAGGSTAAGASAYLMHGTNVAYWWGYVWREADRSVNNCYPLEWSHREYSYGFTQWTSAAINSRTGKNDVKPNVGPFVIDYLNVADKYEIMGMYPGMKECRKNFNKLQTLDVAGTKDMVHLYDGFVVSWPGLTPQIMPL